MKNEKTSKRVAAIAARTMAKLLTKCGCELCEESRAEVCGLSLAELKAICASVLTQAPDKPKRKAK